MKRQPTVTRIPALLLLLSLLAGCSESADTAFTAPEDFTAWSHYLGDPGRSHFSTLDGFTPENISNLEVAWEYTAPDSGQMQMNPLVVDTVLFGVTAALRAFALDARTGEELWVFGDSLKAWHSTSRGLSYWEEGDDRRILYTMGSDLWALDAATGKPVAGFGDGGRTDLRAGLPESAAEKFVISNTPGTVFKNLIIMPLRVSEGAGAAPGDIIAFDIKTGKVAWVFKTLPEAGTPGSETWENPDIRRSPVVGAANNWAGMALDAKNEILYVPTGSAAPDFYGGDRRGANLYANTLLALDANTGERLWHFQFTHHDIWDRDPPAPPNLLTVRRDNKPVPAVAQVTKQGYVYVFNRLTGKPLFDIEEVAVPPSTLTGEAAWATQPIPVKPAPFARQAGDLTEADISPYAPGRDSLRALFNRSDTRLYAPPSLEPVLLLPGYDGAAEWGGAAADPDRGILYVNSNEMAWILSMDETEVVSGNLPPGEQAYLINCAVCHRPDRQGVAASGYPALTGVGGKYTPEELRALIANGKGMMPGFPQLSGAEQEALIAFLLQQEQGATPGDKQEVAAGPAGIPEYQVPYQHTGYHKFLDSNGLPAISPPWGTLHAIDLNTGEYLWQVTLGDTESLKAAGHPPTGCENYGGPVVTENGLLFIAATKDGYFRTFDRHTGALLWEQALPAPAFATPALYEAGGRQYIALACGGEKLGTPAGNKIIAYTLK
ncbi:PQQ-binding-like beta-propeller repeat protein [Robiginitalea sp. SC105]|uniref:outer membrane protein assembly factor BamB family protein n=1 Tax=Robiginitalea sp. SC105 TaxID=2762332 RepID=UPI00163A071D|nr:PQQ-binding-like beta-propeller repeat protein [Robiginitalea sp. SC105]MBC2838189.1 PQQ-binding-like beta-propeller repeat protein [Robiginitalea sp. SC105]